MSTDKSSALTIIEPRDMNELRDFAADAADSRLYGYTAPQALMLAMRGRDLGFSYTQALSAFHMLDGKPTLTADGMVAACIASGHCEYFKVIEQTALTATWETKRKGSEPKQYTFTMADAEAAELTQSKSRMYKKHPLRMLSARAKAYLARDVYPDVLLGLITEDEAQEIAESRPAPRVTVSRVEAPKPSSVASAPAASNTAAPKPYRGEETLTKLRKALDAARDSARVDSVLEHSEKARAELNAEDAGIAIGFFADTRARIEAAQDAQAAAQ